MKVNIFTVDLGTEEEFKDLSDSENIEAVKETSQNRGIIDEGSSQTEVIEPPQFSIGDDRIQYEVNPGNSDKFSETDEGVSMAESSQAEGLFEYNRKSSSCK